SPGRATTTSFTTTPGAGKRTSSGSPPSATVPPLHAAMREAISAFARGVETTAGAATATAAAIAARQSTRARKGLAIGRLIPTLPAPSAPHSRSLIRCNGVLILSPPPPPSTAARAATGERRRRGEERQTHGIPPRCRPQVARIYR